MNKARTGITIFVAVFGIFVLLFSAGCGQKAAKETTEKIIEKSVADKGQSAEVNIDPDSKSFSMTVKDEDGQQKTMQLNANEESASMVVTEEDGNMTMTTGAAAHLPEGFPKDVPMHASMKLSTSPSDGASGFTLQCTSDKSIGELVGYYQETCAKSGWTEEMNLSQNPAAPMHILVFHKNDLALNLIFQAQDGEVHVTVGVGKK